MGKGNQRSSKPPRQPPASPRIAAKFQSALADHQHGKLDRAVVLYREILQIQPAHFDALMLLGHLLLETGQIQPAIEATRKAIGLNPRHPATHFNLGRGLLAQAHFTAAVDSFDRALALMPDYAEALNNRGSALQSLGRHEDAIASFDRAIELQPGDDKAHNNRGISLQKLERHVDAVASFDRALDLANGNGVARNNRGNSLLPLARYEEAIADFDRAIELVPGYVDAFINRGIALPYLGRLEEALASFDRALAHAPDSSRAHNSRGMALLNLGRCEEAIAGFNRAIELSPDYFEAFNNLGLALPYLGRHEEALASYRQALAIKPDDVTAHLNESLYQLRVGDFERGWRNFEWRWQTEQHRGGRREFAPPLWLGAESLHGKTVLLHAEQGFGDTIQMCRYAQLVAARGATVLLEVQAELKPALLGLEGVSQLLAKGEPLPAFDYHCPLLSLPLAFDTRLDSIPAATRYLRSDPGRVARWQARLGAKRRPRVGLAWSGNPGFGNDLHRSIPLSVFAELVTDSAQFVSLHKEVRAADLPILEARRDIVHFGGDLRDFADTAALVELMDVVVTVDTAVAHLAGALGKPVCLLLPQDSDWRWLLKRNDSPWYPSVKLFRQVRVGDWREAIDRVGAELAAAAQYQIGCAVEPSQPPGGAVGG